MSPVKENIPMCRVMCVQEPGVPLALRAWYSSSFMERTRSAIVVTLSHLQCKDEKWELSSQQNSKLSIKIQATSPCSPHPPRFQLKGGPVGLFLYMIFTARSGVSEQLIHSHCKT